MDENERLALRELHTKLMNSLEPLYIQAYLYEKKVLSEDMYVRIMNCKVPTKRAEEFLLYIKKVCPFTTFLKALEYDKAYSFLARELEGKLEEIKNRNSGKTHIQWYDRVYCPIRRIHVFSETRVEITNQRHLMKRLCLQVEIERFNNIKMSLLEQWNASKNKVDIPEEEIHKCADLYFISLDAEIEQRRVQYDKTLYTDQVFCDMKSIIDQTSNPKVSTMLYLARMASAMVMANPVNLQNGLQMVQEATENGERIEPCRETGIVLLIQFYLLCQQYDLSLNQEVREKLIDIAKEAVDHFAQESIEIGNDFRRIIMLKTSFVYLGVGLFCEILNVSVSSDHLRHARSCLSNALKDWNRMEYRWKMIYYFADARIHQLEGRIDIALNIAEISYKHARTGKFYKEKRNIFIFLKYLKHKS